MFTPTVINYHFSLPSPRSLAVPSVSYQTHMHTHTHSHTLSKVLANASRNAPPHKDKVVVFFPCCSCSSQQQKKLVFSHVKLYLRNMGKAEGCIYRDCFWHATFSFSSFLVFYIPVALLLLWLNRIMYVYLSNCLSIYIYICLSINQSSNLSIYLSN